MPPAPTIPTTDAERTFDSNRYNEYEIHSGITWGITPYRISSIGVAPVARTPSTGRGSMVSTASANSLASTPVVCTHSASTPANGPSPTATMNSIANTISLIARAASISRRIGW